MKKDGQRSVPKKQGAKPKHAKKALGRPRLAGESTYMRLDDDTLRRVVAHRDALQERNMASAVSQSDALRDLIRCGLDVAEGKHPLITALKGVLAISSDRARFVAMGPRAFAEAERIARAALDVGTK